MKKTLFAVSLATLTLASVHAKNTDFIKRAIIKGQAHVVKGSIKAKFAVSPADKKECLELAIQQLELKKQALNEISLGKLSKVDLTGVAITSLTCIASTGLLFNEFEDWHNKTGSNRKIWKGLSMFALNTSLLLGALHKLYKESMKKDKKVEAIEKAEKVVHAVERLATKE